MNSCFMHLKAPFASIACIEKSIGLAGDVVISLNNNISFFSFDTLKILVLCPLHVVPPLNPNDGSRILHIKTIDGVEVQECLLSSKTSTDSFSDCSSFRVHFEEINSIQEAKILCGHCLFASYADIEAFVGNDIFECTDASKYSENKLRTEKSAQQKSAVTKGAAIKSVIYGEQISTKELLEHNIKVIDERYGSLGVLKSIIETPANDVWVVLGKFGEVLIPVVDECANSFVPNEEHIVYTHIIDGLIDEKFLKE